ncbi:MAG: polyphosphate kinase 2 family protein [bacterium]|nr:polyphosphate kinase 2 family protein [bacterium]
MDNERLHPDQKIRLSVGGKDDVELGLRRLMVPPGTRVSLRADFDPDFTAGLRNKEAALARVAANVQRLSELQEKLYAQDAYALLIIFQAMDAAGKDGVIRHVMSGVNPQGCQVTSFKVPSDEELDHDYLWRASRALPARGMIGIFNRSYYEEVLVVRVHPELLARQRLPRAVAGDGIWDRRFDEITSFEQYLSQNGIVVLKFFLNVSKEEQRERFLARIDEPDKNWKFSIGDYRERSFWDAYQQAYEEMLNRTSSKAAPWFVIPADHKWFARLAVSEVICAALEKLPLRYPETSDERRRELATIRDALEKEAPGAGSAE